MRDLLELDPSLHEDTVLYRTIDFFGAASIVTKGQLMFSRADTFSDKNEGVDRLLAQLEASLPDGGCGGMGWHNQETALTQHECVKRSHFISCWSTHPESVAMWSLYSTDFCSVRISTTVKKLRIATENLLEKYSFLRLTEEDIGKRATAAAVGRIAPVRYASLLHIAERVSRRLSARGRLADRYARKGQPMPSFNEVDKRYFQREEQRRFRELQTTCNLKDASFQHEGEIRLSVRLGEEIVTKRMLEEQEYQDPEHQYYSVMKNSMHLWGYIVKSYLPEREFVDCPKDMIETVAVDPRCPPHKATFIREWFRSNGIATCKSSCFGYLPESFKVFPVR